MKKVGSIILTILWVSLITLEIISLYYPKDEVLFLKSEFMIALLITFILTMMLALKKNIKNYRKSKKCVSNLNISECQEHIVDVVITTPKEVTSDKLSYQLIKFVEKKGYSMGGSVKECQTEK